MALRLSSSPLLNLLQPALHTPLRPIPHLRQLRYPLLPRIALPTQISIAAIAGVASVLRDVWESILRAVPKKKTSHMKKRHRQMAGKALKDVTALNRCSSCGRPKRAHVLCPYCVQSIKNWFKSGMKDPGAKETTALEKS